jgi:uncharacterized protein with HEPN domain
VSREWLLYLNDMLACCERIQNYTRGLSREQFDAGGMAYDAIVRNMEVLGEAARQIPDAVRAAAPDVEWRGVIAVRNILIHGYFSIDSDILWDLVTHKIQPMHTALQELRKKENR